MHISRSQQIPLIWREMDGLYPLFPGNLYSRPLAQCINLLSSLFWDQCGRVGKLMWFQCQLRFWLCTIIKNKIMKVKRSLCHVLPVQAGVGRTFFGHASVPLEARAFWNGSGTTVHRAALCTPIGCIFCSYKRLYAWLCDVTRCRLHKRSHKPFHKDCCLHLEDWKKDWPADLSLFWRFSASTKRKYIIFN